MEQWLKQATKVIAKIKGRSFDEVQFRLRQEAMNAWIWLRPPRLDPGQMRCAPLLPNPAGALERVKHGGFGDEITRLAENVLAGRYRLLGYDVALADPPPWRRDFVHGKEWPLEYLRRVPYLDFTKVGDHKVTWELNRHQHLVLLAQAWLLTGRGEFLQAMERQFQNWWQENPPQRGINWTSALEVAFRALSWVWVDHLVGDQLAAAVREKLVASLFQHGHHLEYNLSRYFAPNTHLQGEAVALHALGVLYPDTPRAAKWAALGREVIEAELVKQVRGDGAHFEQSTYYHVYALDFFLLHYLLAGRPAHFVPVLQKMAEYLHALMGPARSLPLMGDDDGGRLFHPYGTHDQYGRATLATCARLFGHNEWLASGEDLLPQAAWWLGEAAFGANPAYGKPASRVFSETGMAVLSRGRFWVAFDVGPFGPFSAGHSHSDTLSLVVRVGGSDILIDPGTYTYMADPAWRNRFRGSAAHNTIRVDGQDQAVPGTPFSWTSRPEVRVLAAECSKSTDRVAGEWVSRGVRHTRWVTLEEHALLIRDEGELPPGEHLVEQFWHPGMPAIPFAPTRYRIGPYAEITFRTKGSTVSYEQGGEAGWRSRAYGVKEEAPVICVSVRGKGRVEFETEMTLV